MWEIEHCLYASQWVENRWNMGKTNNFPISCLIMSDFVGNGTSAKNDWLTSRTKSLTNLISNFINKLSDSYAQYHL